MERESVLRVPGGQRPREVFPEIRLLFSVAGALRERLEELPDELVDLRVDPGGRAGGRCTVRHIP